MKQTGRKVQRKGSTTQSWFEIIIYGDVLTGKVKNNTSERWTRTKEVKRRKTEDRGRNRIEKKCVRSTW